MDCLKDMRRERFCNYVALDECTPAEAAFRAGFGASHSTVDQYHVNMANKLMTYDDIVLRINTIRQQAEEKETNYSKHLVQTLKDIVAFDAGKYYKSNNVVLPNGRTITDYYLTKPIQEWLPQDRTLILNGFDSSGRPKFIDKQWALEKLLKLYNLDGKTSIDVEDMFSLFAGAGLPTGTGRDLPKPDELAVSDCSGVVDDLED